MRALPEDMENWMMKHGQARALLDINPPEMPDFQQAPPSQCHFHAASVPAAVSLHGPDEPSILRHWSPEWLPRLFEDASHLRIQKDVCQRPATMAEETIAFRDRVDQSFGWKSKVLDDQQKSYRAAAQATLLPLACMRILSGGVACINGFPRPTKTHNCAP